MDVKILVTGNLNTDFKELITLLDEDLTERNGEIQKFFNPLNNTDHIQAAVVLYHEDIPVACGAYKIYNDTSVEMKRIYVKKDQRRNGFAKQVLNKLEELAKSDGYSYAILETGVKQQEAIYLYQKSGYQIIENYAPYVGKVHSVCMKKDFI